MAKQIINNNDSGVIARTKINDNFTEIYNVTTTAGNANGLATLDSNGKVPSSQLPSYVDDVLTYDDSTLFPVTGEDGKIYIAKDTNLSYRWNGSGYTVVSQSLALGETSSTAYRGDRGKIAYDYSQVGHLQLSGGTTTGNLSLNGQSSTVKALIIAKGQLTTSPSDGGVENDGRTLYHTDYNAARKGFAKEDGTILYHTTAWTTAGTISASGTTVTCSGNAFTSVMVGAKIIAANGEQRIITAYTSATSVTIDRAFVGSISGSAYGVYNKAIEVTSDGTKYFYTNNSGVKTNINNTNILSLSENSILLNPVSGLSENSAAYIRWSNSSTDANQTKDLGIRRNTSGILEIFDGVTADGAIANLRDLLLRSISIKGQSSTIAAANITSGTKKTTPASGDVQNDGQTLMYADSGATNIGLSGIIYSAGAAQVIANTTTETSLFSSTAYSTTPNIREISANSLKTGKAIRIKMSGIVSTGSPTSNATLRLKVGGTTIATVSEPLANNMTNYYFDKEITIVCRTTGSSGTGIFQGKSQICKSDGTNFSVLPITTTTAFTLNTTQANVIDLTFEWGAASASNTITISTATIEILG